MTTPEKKPLPLEPKRRLGAESMHMFEVAQTAIEETRKLLEELADQHNMLRNRGK